MDRMVNICESLQRRYENKPKMLTGLDQKVGGQERGLLTPSSQMSLATGARAEPNLSNRGKQMTVVAWATGAPFGRD